MCLWKLKTLKKLRMWFWSKNRTIDEIIRINKIIDLHTKRLLSKLEELDQNKVYVCKLPGASIEETKLILTKNALNKQWFKKKKE